MCLGIAYITLIVTTEKLFASFSFSVDRKMLPCGLLFFATFLFLQRNTSGQQTAECNRDGSQRVELMLHDAVQQLDKITSQHEQQFLSALSSAPRDGDQLQKQTLFMTTLLFERLLQQMTEIKTMMMTMMIANKSNSSEGHDDRRQSNLEQGIRDENAALRRQLV